MKYGTLESVNDSDNAKYLAVQLYLRKYARLPDGRASVIRPRRNAKCSRELNEITDLPRSFLANEKAAVDLDGASKIKTERNRFRPAEEEDARVERTKNVSFFLLFLNFVRY